MQRMPRKPSGSEIAEANMPPDVVGVDATIAGRGPHILHFKGTPCSGDDKPRRGASLSSRTRRRGHSGQLEAEAVLIAIRRIARERRLHSHRSLVRMGGASVLAALRKGRSSAKTIRGAVRRVSGFMLAANIRIRFGYVPSEWNPADARSMGGRTRHN